MYWNNYANFNPAMSGLRYRLHASGTYTNYYPSLAGSDKNLTADVGGRFNDRHGLGVAYNGEVSNNKAHKILANYNYQFQLKKATYLAIGTGIGFGTYSSYDPLSSTFPSPTNSRVSTFELNLGIAYKWKSLYVGVSSTSLKAPESNQNSFSEVPPTAYYAHAEYHFPVSNLFYLTPRLLYSYTDGFQRLQANLSLTYNAKFSLGVSSKFRNDFGINARWDIRNTIRVGYNYSVTVSKLNNNVSGGVHEFVLAYLMKPTPIKVKITRRK